MGKNGIECCQKCQVYWTCDTKWYRGEKNEENICCPRCNFYVECLQHLNKSKGQKK